MKIFFHPHFPCDHTILHKRLFEFENVSLVFFHIFSGYDDFSSRKAIFCAFLCSPSFMQNIQSIWMDWLCFLSVLSFSKFGQKISGFGTFLLLLPFHFTIRGSSKKYDTLLQLKSLTLGHYNEFYTVKSRI